MTRQIDRFVAENRERIRNVDNRFVEVDSARDRNLSFGPSTFTVSVDVDVFKRSTGTQAVVGHAAESKGFGRGTFGDDRGAWDAVDVTVDTVFTRQGRRAVVRALNAEAGAVTTTKAGVGTDDPVTADTDLTGVYAVTRTTNRRPDTGEAEIRGVHDAVAWVGGVVELGIFDAEDRLLARIVATSADAIDATDDVRVDVTLTFDGDGVGNSVITEAGEDVVADAMVLVLENHGPTEFRFGSGDPDFDKESTGLADEQFTKACERLVDRNRITARTHVFETEPAGLMPVDVSEMAVFDDDDRMIWATELRTFTKRDDAAFNAESEFRVV